MSVSEIELPSIVAAGRVDILVDVGKSPPPFDATN